MSIYFFLTVISILSLVFTHASTHFPSRGTYNVICGSQIDLLLLNIYNWIINSFLLESASQEQERGSHNNLMYHKLNFEK